MMLWPKWVVLIAGSTGCALCAVRPPNRHLTLDVRHDLVYAASAAGSLYRSPWAIIAHAILASLLARPCGRRPLLRYWSSGFPRLDRRLIVRPLGV
jgi:hypothetical protein